MSREGQGQNKAKISPASGKAYNQEKVNVKRRPREVHCQEKPIIK